MTFHERQEHDDKCDSYDDLFYKLLAVALVQLIAILFSLKGV